MGAKMSRPLLMPRRIRMNIDPRRQAGQHPAPSHNSLSQFKRLTHSS